MLEDEILAPLKMRDTSLGLREKDSEARYCPIKAAWSGGGVLPPETVEGMNLLMRIPGAEIPGGGAVSTMEDLFRFVEMLRNGGELDGARILSPAMIEYASRNQTGDLPHGPHGFVPEFAQLVANARSYRARLFSPRRRNHAGTIRSAELASQLCRHGCQQDRILNDPQSNLSFTFLSTGLMEGSRNLERLGILSRFGFGCNRSELKA